MIVTINFSYFKENSDLHNYLKEKLSLSNYYGNNLDALYDELSTYNYNVSFSFLNPKTKYHNLVIDCIKNAAKTNKKIKIK